MNNDLKTLMDFLGQFGPEVCGKAIPTPQSQDAARIDRLVRGECNQIERTEVCQMLRMHPTWLRWLADRVRMNRPQSAGSGS